VNKINKNNIRVFAVVVIWWLLAPMAFAERTEPLPSELEGVGVVEHLDIQVPDHLAFKDTEGNDVVLGDFFTGQRPIILTLNYSNCPMLCHLQLDGLVDGLRQVKWILNKDYDIITVSIDPKETIQRAHLTKKKYIKRYERPESAPGWHFLVGSEANIKALADAVGFGYTYNEERDEYVHAAAIMILSPTGHVSRYLYGVIYEPQNLKFALLEASEGKVGSTLDQVVMYCFHYDAEAGRYAPAAMRLMRLGGLAFVVVLGAVFGVFWRRDVRRKKHAGGKQEA
jgi:protein SCO1/2